MSGGGDPNFSTIGSHGRPGIRPALCPVWSRLDPRCPIPGPRMKMGAGQLSCNHLPQPWLPISSSHVQATEAFLPGNSQSSCAIKSACGHPGIQSLDPGENALGPGPNLSKSHRWPETSRASQGGARPGARPGRRKIGVPTPSCWSETYQGWAPSTHCVPGSKGRFIGTLF